MAEEAVAAAEASGAPTSSPPPTNGEAPPQAADGATPPPVSEELLPPPLRGLKILPPLQKAGSNTTRDELLDAVALPPIRLEEPVSSIRGALADVIGYSHLTNYRFELEPATPSSAGSSTNNDKKDTSPAPFVESPYTGPNAVVSVPAAIKSLNEDGGRLLLSQSSDTRTSAILDDYGELLPLVEKGLQDGSALRIVLERYDAAAVKDHVARLRVILQGNAPSLTTLDEGSPEPIADKEEEHETSKPEKPEKTQEEQEKEKEEAKQKAAAEAKKRPKDLPYYRDDEDVVLDGTNLEDFFFLAAGEEKAMYDEISPKKIVMRTSEGPKKSKKKKNKKKDQSTTPSNGAGDHTEKKEEERPVEEVIREIIPRLNALEETARIKCSIRFSGFHPPPMARKIIGDLAYLEVNCPGEKDPIHITAVPTGFYVSRSSSTNGDYKFDPSPAAKHCFSHELLDCLIMASASFRKAWIEAVEASKERSKKMIILNQDGTFAALSRVAIRGEFSGYKEATSASASEGVDNLLQVPSWIVPVSKIEKAAPEAWNKNALHAYNPTNTEDDLSNAFGIDFRGGAMRDWNEELQGAREMPMDTINERIERARVLNKVLSDFGEASVLGVKAISEGHIAPMNPNEPTRSQVYLHNNIFFSRAIDGGVETFKIARGDKAARKSASRDVHCLGVLHRIERSGIYTLATSVIDYLGTRFVCQSILPGILNGEKTHKLMYGSVEAGTPLMWEQEMHDLLEKTLSKNLMIATRPLPREPLTDERLAEVEIAKKNSPLYLERREDEKKDEDSEPLSKTIWACAPVEAKGIKGSDQRHYVLDMTRLTPRDANWIPQDKGGTGKWEEDMNTSKKVANIPTTLEDDEWTLSVLRSELVTKYTQLCMSKYMAEKSEKEAKDKEKGEDAAKKKLSEEDLDYLASLRFNVNVFLPDIKSLEGLDDEALEQVKNDEEVTRKASIYLWDEVIPGLIVAIRNGTISVPSDGRALTELIHVHGVNCRYLGRLAQLAQAEEEKDREQNSALNEGKPVQLYRRTLPKAWLELLECEMVARAAKHVLDSYLTENGGVCAILPGQTIASFLSALISEREETAGETETRMERGGASQPDEEDLNSLTISNVGGGGDAMPSATRGRTEVWEDIENEVARRFRYNLTLFNRGGKSGRTLYIPLLRRVCQRTGVRIAAKNYEVGGKCLCSNSSGAQVAPSYPVSTADIVDIVPLIKHAAAHSEGFVPCHTGPGAPLPPLHISLPDARSALEHAHVARSRRQLQTSLELAQEAAALYQRVTETQSHPGVVGALDLMAAILFDAGEPGMAANHALKALGLLVQTGGFDTHDVVQAHLVLFNMFSAAGEMTRAIKHLRAGIYLSEVLAGPNYPELANCYHKLGSIYRDFQDLRAGLNFEIEAEQRDSPDRFLKALIQEGKALSHASVGEYKEACAAEKAVLRSFTIILGPNSDITKNSEQHLQNYTKMAVSSGNIQVANEQQQIEAQKADAIADEIAAAEAAEEAKQKKKKNKKKGKK